ncbi:LacI family DNA-binding transcriptional regulator [Tessaracoccus sp. MC1679]|uniref:LacI family DNA-binding transcriptional regulator n=1 Tax=Tessaracoccus sp. MC1679 TaxID=2760313 RepID=UPI0016048399|nr:LacI family DNA-binding transcriptional regulator [Tessaracoccus sp. MC1679]MBB1517345.1 LacI family DNA-binding transcriptional regulator [Tessaracoccus sp. MC1679]
MNRETARHRLTGGTGQTAAPLATIMDVAAHAGVSRGTVSRVLNGSPKVSPEARAAVEQAIDATNYRSNPHARSLASGRSNAVAVLLTQPQRELFEDPTFSVLLQGVSDGLAGSDTALVLLLAGNEEERRRTTKFLDSRHVDGVIHLSPHVNDPMLKALLSADVPVVLCGAVPDGPSRKRVWSATITDRQGGADAGRHLVERGARRVAIIAGAQDEPGSLARLAGFRDALGDAFDEALVYHGDYGIESGRAGLAALLDRDATIDAVFCASDRMAVGAYQTARSRGLRIPDDLRVVGFDGHALGLDLAPPLTTVAQPIRALGRAAVQMLTEATNGDDPGNRVFATELIVRASS